MKHNDAEMRMLPNVLPVATSPGGIEPRPNCLWTSQPGGEEGGITMKFHAIGDSSPPNTLLKQELAFVIWGIEGKWNMVDAWLMHGWCISFCAAEKGEAPQANLARLGHPLPNSHADQATFPFVGPQLQWRGHQGMVGQSTNFLAKRC